MTDGEAPNPGDPQQHAKQRAAEVYARESAELRSKRAAADLIRAVVTAPDDALPPAVRDAKRKLMETA